MKKRKHNQITFKAYHQHQQKLFPPSLDELIPGNHMVRFINDIIERMKIDHLIKEYKGGGSSSYHPRMLLKILIYAYSQKVYSSRQIAKLLRENIHYMWLAADNRPDFRTINRFRSGRLKSTIEEVFSTVVEFLLEEGLVDLSDYYLDGTKIEANANKYSFVWGRATKTFKSRLQSGIRELFKEIEQINAAEDRHYGQRDLAELGEGKEISSARLAEKVKELEERLSGETANKQMGKALKKLKEDYLPRQKKYEEQEKILGNRNSYSKTDQEATFMRMKEDHMKNGQLKAGYNVQMGTQNQYILGYSIHQQPSDSGLLIPHLEQLKEQRGRLPEKIIADAGYGSEENYAYLDKEEVTGYVKYNNFHYEQTKKFKKDKFRVENLSYDESRDVYICPGGKELIYLETEGYRTANGYQTTRRVYQCVNCDGCELRSYCHKSKYNRKIKVSHTLNGYKKQARDRLNSEEGKQYRSRRPIEVESVFGQLKHNGQFRRFILRGMDKVRIEYGLLSIAHNLKKWWKQTLPQPADSLKIAIYFCNYFKIPFKSYIFAR